MNEEDIIEAWQTVNGGDPPAAFLSLVREYKRRKEVFGPELFGITDFTVCTMLYDLTKGRAPAGAKKNG